MKTEITFESAKVHIGRKLEYFIQTSGENIGYPSLRDDRFGVLHPENEIPRKEYPLYVVFHSAGHDLESTLQCMVTPGDHDIYHTPDDSFALVLDCKKHDDTDWWWGGIDAHGKGNPARSGTNLMPVETRCIESIEWTLNSFPIDRERVYAVGNSMGGSGALGIALRRGDLFAAIKANVPAGVRHAADRCCLDKSSPNGFTIPDPPIVVDYSAQNDDWSEGQRFYTVQCASISISYSAFSDRSGMKTTIRRSMRSMILFILLIFQPSRFTKHIPSLQALLQTILFRGRMDLTGRIRDRSTDFSAGTLLKTAIQSSK